MKKRAKKLVLTVFYCINSYLATWKIVYRSVSLWIITRGLSRPSLASLQGFLQEYHRKKGQKSSFSCILSLYTHPAKGCRMNSNSLMGLFDYFWVTSQYALPRLGWNGNSRAFNRRSFTTFLMCVYGASSTHKFPFEFVFENGFEIVKGGKGID